MATHLDKGTRGVSSNADLLVGHEDLERPVLIQVKSCFWKNFDSAFMGAYQIDGKLFNRKSGFKADVIASVTVKSLAEYRVYFLWVNKIEKTLFEAYKKFHQLPKVNGGARRPVPTMYVPLTGGKTVAKRTSEKAGEIILAGQNDFDALFNPRRRCASV